MTFRRYGDVPNPSVIPYTGDPLDKGVLKLFGADVQNIDLNMGWGTSATTCKITLVEEEDGVFSEPKMGSPVRIAIPNNKSGIASLYDRFDPNSSLNFIGLVKTVDSVDNTGGNTKEISLVGLKEILKNIPVIIGRISNRANTFLSKVGNITYAYDDDSANSKGLKMSAIQASVEAKTYTYFPSYWDSLSTTYPVLQEYEIDMSEMFKERGDSYLTRKYSEFYGIDNYNNGKYTSRYDDGKAYIRAVRENFGDLFGNGDRDDDIDEESIIPPEIDQGYDDDTDYICDPNYRIDGFNMSLLDIIEKAMNDNGCDWYIKADEENFENSLNTGVIYNKIIIKIIPIVRNRLNAFSKVEFNTFIGSLNNVQSSKTYGTELVNEETNKVYFGANWEILQKVDVEDMNQFWGFKKPEYGIDEHRDIEDKYGNTIRVRGDINLNPTFDTSGMSYVEAVDDLFPDFHLKNWLTNVFGYENSEVASLSRTELIDAFKDSTTFNDSYEFDLSGQFSKYMFYLLGATYKKPDIFKALLETVYNYVEWYDDNSSKTNNGLTHGSGVYSSSTGYDSLTFCGETVTNGEVINLSSKYSGDISLSFTHNIPTIAGFSGITLRRGGYTNKSNSIVASGSYRVANAFDISLNGLHMLTIATSGVENAASIDVNISDLAKNMYSQNNDKSKEFLKTMFYGLNVVTIKAHLHDDSGNNWDDSYFIYLKWFPTDSNGTYINPHDELRASPLYSWSKALGIKFINNKFEKENDISDYGIIAGNLGIVASSGSSDYKKLYVWNKYQNWQRDTFNQRFVQLHNIVSSYLDEYLDKKYYKKVDNNSWLVVPEVWDGIYGYQISNSYVRGKFINKDNGKMPALYRIKSPENVNIYKEDDDLMYIKGLNNTSEITNIYGRATVQMYAVGKSEDESADNRYVICSMQTVPERIDRPRLAATSLNYPDSLEQNQVDDTTKGLDVFFEEAFTSQIGSLSADSQINTNWVTPIYRIKPHSFYIPTQHEYIRYGPWILDYRRDDNTLYGGATVRHGSKLNRSNYGQTNIILDSSLNPWEFKSYGEIQNYIIYQNKNSLLTEYRTNRGQVVAEDIPRYNLGHSIGRFSNISSVSINYGQNGVSTTYSLTTFGIGSHVKEQREKQNIMKRLRNIEIKEQKSIPLIDQTDLNVLLGRK